MTQYAKASAFGGGGGFNSPMTTQGDLITQDATDPIRLAIGGAATVLTSDGTDPSWEVPVGPVLTPSRAVQTNAGTGLVEVSTVTSAELAHVSGVTSAIQTQINAKEPTVTATTIADYYQGDKTFQPKLGLPISTATQTALDGKQDAGVGESTGVLTGGVMTAGTASNQYSVADGTGQIVDADGSITLVSWSGHSNIVPTNLATQLITFVGINSAGNIVEQTGRFTNTQSRIIIVLGVAVHVNLVSVDTVNNEQNVVYNVGNQLMDLQEAIGFFNISGNVFSANGANLNINKSIGVMSAHGANYQNDLDNPNALTLAAVTQASFQYRFSDGSNGVTGIAFDPANLDNGAGGLTALSSNNKWGVSRVYSFTSNNIKIQRGVEEFDSKDKALAGFAAEPFVTEPSIAANGMLRGWIVHKKNALDMSNDSQIVFIEAPKFQGSTGGIGSSASTLQDVYDNSANPEILTNVTQGALTLRRGSGADTDDIYQGQNNAGTETFSVTGNGLIKSDTLTASRAMVSNASKELVSSATTDTELGYVNGVTSAIQTQINAKGPALYDAVVDAAGGGDYTTISSAYTTEAAGATIYIRNGAYSESAFITIKAGTKLIGESREGVVITFTGTSWGLFRGEFGAYRGGSERTANNDAWNTTNMGTVSVTNGSTAAVYTGTTNPVAADLIHIAPNFYAIASSVDTGTKTITLDRNWGGDTLSGLDIMVHDTIVTDTETRTEFSNFTIILNAAGGQISAFRNLNTAYNMHISDIKILATAVASGASVFNLQAMMRSSVNDVEIDCNSQTTLKPFLIYNGISDFHCNSIVAYNVATNGVQFQGGTRAVRRSTLHFKSLACSGNALFSMTGIYQSDIRFDVVQCDRISAASGGTAANLAESRVEIRKANVNTSFTVFEGIKSFFAFNYVSDSVQVFNQTNATDFVCVTDSYIDGTLIVDAETVISGSVMYDAISGTPAQNNGFEF